MLTRAEEGFGLLEVMISSVLILSTIAAAFTLAKLQNIGDPAEATAAMQIQRRAAALESQANYSSQDADGDPWDLDTVQPETTATINGTEFTTTHSVAQAPGGRAYRIATVTTTWTQLEI